MCKKVVYQAGLELRAMEQELRRLKERGIQENELNRLKGLREEDTIYKDHFSKAGKILSSHDPEHERDELCWIGDKQVSVNDEIAKLNMRWINTSNELRNLKDDPELTKKAAIYKDFFDNAKKVTAAVMGAAGQAPLLLDLGGEVREVTVEEMVAKEGAKEEDRGHN